MDLFSELGHCLIGRGFTVGEEGAHRGRNSQELAQHGELIGIQHRVDRADAPENFAGTIEARPWQVDIASAHGHEAADQRCQVVDTGAVAGWAQGQDCGAAAGGAGVCGQQFEELVVFEDATGVRLHAPRPGYKANPYMMKMSASSSARASAS